MKGIRRATLARIIGVGALLGAAGGTAEIGWIALYGWLAGVDAGEVARAISSAVSWAIPNLSLGSAPVVYGIIVHMVAAVALGIALVLVWNSLNANRSAGMNAHAFMVGALAIVWAFNFFVVLPLIGPAVAGLDQAFVGLIPYPASLASKLLFGLAGAVILRCTAVEGATPIPIRIGVH